jgi:chromosome segregation ATPase
MWRFLRLMPLLLLAPDDGAPGGGAQDSDDPDGAGGTEDPKGNQDTTGENDQAIETLQAELDELKKQSSSKDKSVTKLTKQLEELKQALMTDEERKAAEESEHAERIAEERKAFLTDCKAVAAERAGLSEENAQLISGETQEEIRENGKMLKALVEQQFSVRYEKAKKEGMKGKVPQAGDDPAAGIMPL